MDMVIQVRAAGTMMTKKMSTFVLVYGKLLLGTKLRRTSVCPIARRYAAQAGFTVLLQHGFILTRMAADPKAHGYSPEKNVVDTEMGPIRFTISLGVTDLREGDEDIESLLKRADIGLYRSKEAGRNRVSCE
ncbi:MAG: diguanylate cyclase [Gammaproteobacteria bacterium]|nr:MAG: diguanylate cyclase [Gammaproteobacteria bacterium]